MKLKILLPTIILTALLSATSLYSQEPLTLEQARANALAHSKTLRKALLSVDSALLTEKTQWYDFLPSISANVGVGLSYPGSSLVDALQGTAGVSVTQTIYDGGKSSLLSAIDAMMTSIAREEARTEYFGVLEKVDSAFYGLLEAQSSVEAATSDVEAARTHLRLAEAKLEENMITRFAYLETESSAAAKETALIQAQGKLSVAEATLASLTVLPTPLAVASVDFASREQLMQRLAGLSGENTQTFIAGALKAATANNPTLSQAALAGRKAKKAVDLAGVDYLPSLSASFSHELSVGSAQGLDAGNGSLSVSVSIPLDFWATKAGVEAKEIAARQAELDGDESQRTLALEIQGAVYDCISSARSSFSSKKALEYAESYYQGVLERYRLSSASSSDLSDAAALVSTNRTALISARYSFLSNLSSLRTLAGLESENLLTSLVP
jgi:outer membrane protein